jgi:hypothetical protein
MYVSSEDQFDPLGLQFEDVNLASSHTTNRRNNEILQQSVTIIHLPPALIRVNFWLANSGAVSGPCHYGLLQAIYSITRGI